MTLAVGDGNHSLATAKAYWEERKATLTPEQQLHDPARYCLAEVCNVHSPAIQIEPIHRVLFGTDSPWSSQQESLTAIEQLSLTPSEREQILGENARRLLQLA